MAEPNFPTPAEARALTAMFDSGEDAAGLERMLLQLRAAGLRLVDVRNELACRWVDVRERPVPPEADTIIRTLTRSIGNQSWTATYWLEGLRAPAMPGPMIWATDRLTSSLLLPSTSCSRLTRAGKNAWSAMSKNTVSTPLQKPTTYSCSMLSVPAARS